MFIYSMKIDGQRHTFELRPIAEMPESIAPAAAKDGGMWHAFHWGLADYNQANVLECATLRQLLGLYKAWQDDSHVTVTEIAKLVHMIQEHRNPLAADLINSGMRLRDFPSDRHNWHDLWVFVLHMDTTANSYMAANPERAGWTRATMILADIADAAGWLQWSKTTAAADGGEPPDRMVRPGIKGRQHRGGSKVRASPISRIKQLAFGNRETSPEERQRKLAKAFG